MRAVEGARTLPWLYPDTLKSVATTLTGPFLLDAIAKRAKWCMDSNGLAEGKQAEEKDAVWYF